MQIFFCDQTNVLIEEIVHCHRNSNVDGVDYIRRLDIADEATSRGVELKTGYQSATQANLWELERDKALMDDGWNIQWVFKGTASEPLKNALKNAGIPFVGG